MIDRAAHISNEAQRFADVLASTDPAAKVPTCPDWTARDLLKHLTQVHAFWATVIGDRLTGPQVGEYEESVAPLPDDFDQLLALRDVATQDLITALRSREPGEEAWSWFPPQQTVDFTWRMQTHEATMHRVDAELTAGQPVSGIASDVAADGIDHVLDVMWAWVPNDAERRHTGTLELVATDTEQRWVIDTFRWTGSAWGQDFTDQAGCSRSAGNEPAATVTGTAAELDLLLWNRGDDVDQSGDEAVLQAFGAVLDDGIQ